MNSKKLIEWYLNNSRDLPWRKQPEPYNVWISEIILQQTQMNRGVEYYKRFVEKYPDVFSLSSADEQDVLRLWQGLGYYSRARNLHQAAKEIVEKYLGKFPDDPLELKKIRGIGDYTASAIASIAFNRKTVVADGNVIRVISRLYLINEPVDKSSVVRKIKSLAFDLMGKHQPSLFNQALMELGSLICKPQNPLCTQCPLRNNCKAFHADVQIRLPVKSKKIKRSVRYLHYLYIIDSENRFYLKQRMENDIWKHLWEFPLVETEHDNILSFEEILNHLPLQFNSLTSFSFMKRKIHKLTHIDVYAFLYKVEMKVLLNEKDGYILVTEAQLRGFPVHNLMKWSLEKLF
jgi:A/G-specific adenine glycosylase